MTEKEIKDLEIRWKEMQLKLKFNSCDEATTFWDEDWLECPVCGARFQLANPLDNDEEFVLVHKGLEELIQ